MKHVGAMLELCWDYVEQLEANFEHLQATFPLEDATWPFEAARGAKSEPQDAFQQVGGGVFDKRNDLGL